MRKLRDFDKTKEDLRDATDLVSFISRYIELTQRGQRWVGLCPFHDDKNNPGFAVSPEQIYTPTQSKGVWGCWSCEAKGDLFEFVMRQHDATFIEAITIIAEITGFDLMPYYRDLTPEEDRKEQQYAAAEQVADLFCDELLDNKKKLQFFLDRGLEPAILREFKVGWSPSVEFLQEAVDREVINFLEPKLQNRIRLFGNRFVYPQFTIQGRVWGWYARQPDDRPEGMGKYIGTSDESPLFDGAERIYGFSQSRKLARTSKYPYSIVEGFHDTLAGQQAGFPTIGACGTNLSAKQIEALQTNGVRKAIVWFDPDDAGRKGMLKLAERDYSIHGIQLQFVAEAAEPEEFIADQGADAFGNCLNNALGALDFIVANYATMDTSTPMKKRDFLDHVRPFVVHYPRQSLTRALGIQSISEIVGLEQEVVADYFDEKANSPLANLTGELIVLSELATNPQAWVTLAEVAVTDFSLRRYAQTYALMRDLFEREAEVNIELLVLEAHNRHAADEIKETIGKLQSVVRSTPELFAADIRDKAIRRQAAEMGEQLTRQSMDLKTPVIETVGQAIERVTSSMSTTVTRTTWTSAEAVTLFEKALEDKVNSDSSISGLNAGPEFEWITMMLNGFRPGRTFCIAATSGIGKSILAANLIHRLSIATKEEHESYPEAAGFVVSMEMTPAENIERIAAIDSDVPQQFIEHGRFETQEQCDAVLTSLEKIRSAPITWMEGNCSIHEIALRSRLLQARGQLDYIVIDYVQLLDLSAYSDRWSVVEKYNQASNDIKNLAQSLHVPVIMVAQLNRSAMGEDIPTGEQMGSSYKIYQDAHACFILAPREDMLIGSLDKNRGSGKGAINIHFDSNPTTSTLRMKEGPVRSGKKSR